jgi:hypothetical protein
MLNQICERFVCKKKYLYTVGLNILKVNNQIRNIRIFYILNIFFKHIFHILTAPLRDFLQYLILSHKYV